MTGLFHGAAEAGRVRDACMTARSLVQIAELVAKIADAIPTRRRRRCNRYSVWPAGRTLPVVPLETDAELAEAGGYVTPAPAAPAPAAPAPVAGAGAPAADDPDDFVPFDEADDPEEP